MFYDYKSLKTNAGDNKQNDVTQNDTFYVKLDEDYNVNKIKLILSIIDNVTKTIDCKIYNTYNSNFLSVKYYKKINNLENTILSNSSKIDTNKNDISTNLIGINTNEDNIAYNLSEINYIKNNIPKLYLKIFITLYFMIQKLKLILEIHFMKKYLTLMLIKMVYRNDF